MISKYTKTICILLIVVVTGCKKPITAEEIILGDTAVDIISIAGLTTKYLKSTPVVITDDIAIRGQIISSDWAGAFPNSLLIMDETGSIEIRVASGNYNNSYGIDNEGAVGVVVTVKCAGFIIGTYGNAPQLGISYNYETYECNKIPENEMNKYIISSGERKEVDIPLVELSQITRDLLNKPVVLNNVTFIDEHKGLKWCDEGKSGFSERLLISTTSEDTLTVRTYSGHMMSHFLVPAGTGKLEGIIQYYYDKPSIQMIDAGKTNL